MSQLPPFSLTSTVRGEDARHDKISLLIKNLILTGSEHAIHALRSHLAIPPPGISGGRAARYGTLFNRPGNSVWMPLKIRASERGRSAASPLPLFEGTYSFRSPPWPYEWLTEAELSLNLTRFIRNQNGA